jgi:hypothetical protein
MFVDRVCGRIPIASHCYQYICGRLWHQTGIVESFDCAGGPGDGREGLYPCYYGGRGGRDDKRACTPRPLGMGAAEGWDVERRAMVGWGGGLCGWMLVDLESASEGRDETEDIGVRTWTKTRQRSLEDYLR